MRRDWEEIKGPVRHDEREVKGVREKGESWDHAVQDMDVKRYI